MKFDGQQIKKFREAKGLTQKELAEHTNLNTRTIQRIENNETHARAFTLNRIAGVLGFSIDDFQKEKASKTIVQKLIYSVGYIIINLCLVFIFGYLIMDSNANFNALFGAFVLSISLPFLILHYTKNLIKEERLLKFGIGLWLYVILFAILHGPVVVFGKGLIYPVVIYSVVLFVLGKREEQL
jgi:transcriptional regulator with XRE-family HTH domain